MDRSSIPAVGAAVAVLLCACLSGAGCGSSDSAAPEYRPDAATAGIVEEVLTTASHPWLRWPDLADVAPALDDLYRAEPDRLFWFSRERPESALAEAIESISRAEERGLDPEDYDAERIEADGARLPMPEATDGPGRALFDLAVSVGMLRLIDAVHTGRVDPRTLDWGYDVRPKKVDRAAFLRAARDGEGVTILLNRLEPSYPHYVRNREVLALYRRLARNEPLPVPSLPRSRRKVRPAEIWEGVPLLRARLRILGDLADRSPEESTLYDGSLVEAVKRFQSRHILDADGVIGKATIEAVNVPFEQRVRQLELAMEKGRWLPELGDRPSLFVNVPIFRLWASNPVRGEEPLRMNVVVGEALSHQTPIFVQQMEYVVFRPYWSPTLSIARDEIVPRVRRDPSYLERENMEIVASGAENAPPLSPTPENLDKVAAGRLFVRQKPGPRNSLGLVKFIFPNQENVYMHGTPAQALFSRTRRDFSHGCIRLEKPTELAEWVLRDVPGWARDRIEEAMNGERPLQVNLPEPIMVVIFYDTVHVNSEGVVHFAEDIYKHDRALDEALSRGYPYQEFEQGVEGVESRLRREPSSLAAPVPPISMHAWRNELVPRMQKGHEIDELTHGHHVAVVGHSRDSSAHHAVLGMARRELVRRIDDRRYESAVRGLIVHRPSELDGNRRVRDRSGKIETSDFVARVALELEKRRLARLYVTLRQTKATCGPLGRGASRDGTNGEP